MIYSSNPQKGDIKRKTYRWNFQSNTHFWMSQGNITSNIFIYLHTQFYIHVTQRYNVFILQILSGKDKKE